jgi:hypothetical protein
MDEFGGLGPLQGERLIRRDLEQGRFMERWSLPRKLTPRSRRKVRAGSDLTDPQLAEAHLYPSARDGTRTLCPISFMGLDCAFLTYLGGPLPATELARLAHDALRVGTGVDVMFLAQVESQRLETSRTFHCVALCSKSALEGRISRMLSSNRGNSILRRRARSRIS